MFRKYTRKHNKGIFVGFIKPSECRMGGELISLLRLLRLKDALRSTINSKEFLNLNNFKEECCVLNNDNFWMYFWCVVFCICTMLQCVCYIWLINKQRQWTNYIFFVLQTDRMLIKWLPDCEKKSTELIRDTSLGQVMTNCKKTTLLLIYGLFLSLEKGCAPPPSAKP